MSGFKRFSLFFAVLALLALAVLPAAAQDTSHDDNTITVVGSGSASGAPDIANVEIGVESRNADVGAAFTATNEKIDNVIQALVEAGVAREDIRTVGLNIYQDFYPRGMMMEPTGDEMPVEYVVSNQIRITVRDIDLVADAINAAVNAGANNIYGLNFGISDREALEAEARAAAIENARMRAGQLAELVGMELGAVTRINENMGGFGPFDVLNLAVQRDMGFGGGVPIEPGQLSVSVQLQVTFRMADN